ncbi:hypothetical protein C8Q72DRAFT_327216 [Fomitopsis betulina]|nr:hypothetical protein C8Q72DRAFT_327216 [Fomitopsis betulina]
MRFTSVFVLAIAATAPATLASYSEFDARDDTWTSLAARGGEQSKPPSKGASAYGKWNGQSSYKENSPDPPTNHRRWVEGLEKRVLFKGRRKKAEAAQKQAKQQLAWTPRPKSYEYFKANNPIHKIDPNRHNYGGSRTETPSQVRGAHK